MSRLEITSIGTCRLNTPLRRAQTRFPIEVNDALVYGFTPTSDRALQHLKFLHGEKKRGSYARRVIFRRAASNAARNECFEAAADPTKQLVRLGSSVEANSRNFERCRIMAARRRNSSSSYALVEV